jgi:hypothetical protein
MSGGEWPGELRCGGSLSLPDFGPSFEWVGAQDRCLCTILPVCRHYCAQTVILSSVEPILGFGKALVWRVQLLSLPNAVS